MAEQQSGDTDRDDYRAGSSRGVGRDRGRQGSPHGALRGAQSYGRGDYRAGSSRGRGRGRRGNPHGATRGAQRYRSSTRDPHDEKSQKKHWKVYYGFTRLQELKEKDPNEILVNLTWRPDSLKEALNEPDHDENMISLLLVCCSKASKCSSLQQKKIKLLQILRTSEFIQSTLHRYLTPLTTLTPDDFETHEKNILDILSLCHDMKQSMPTAVFLLHGITEKISEVCRALRENYDYENLEIDSALNKYKSEEEKPLSEASIRKTKEELSKDDDRRKPPEHFQTIPVFPDASDLNMDSRPFLRPNKTCGGYQDLDHYLDVQYRLLREDFIAPLREGIQEYRKALQSNDKLAKFRTMKIYTDAEIISPICQSLGVCHEVLFSCKGFSRIRWETSKRLIFGSLLCISTDDYNTFSFATVVNRDQVKDGIIVLNFEKGANSKGTIIPSTKFVMAETSAYFEAYRHVLQSLKNIKHGELPFEKYIVACDPKVSAPAYLTRSAQGDTLDLTPLVDDFIIIRDETMEPGARVDLKEDLIEEKTVLSAITRRAQTVHALDLSSWPEPELLHMDMSQYRALQQALTSEFVLVQGPPGTGKTYVGLKITKALLHNHLSWNYIPASGKLERRPILVVCYTNHALDQFLEGVVDFYKGDVVRVGGRISSDRIQHFSIKDRRQAFRQSKALPKILHQEKLISRDRMEFIKLAINEFAERKKNAKLAILHEECLTSVIQNELYQSLIIGYDYLIDVSKSEGMEIEWNSAMFEWLGYGRLSNSSSDVPIVSKGQSVEQRSDEFIAVLDEVDVEVERRQIDSVDDGEYEIRYSEEARAEVGQILESMGLQRKSLVYEDTNDEKDGDEDNEDSRNDAKVNVWQVQPKEKRRQKKKIKLDLNSDDKMDQNEADRVEDVWTLSKDDRWRLYRYWVHEYCNLLQEQMSKFEDEFQNACQAYAEIQIQEDKEILKNAAVIGMTTTGAAKYQSVLKDIGPRIIIVEEAAEVLEAHIVATLSSACEHLILIGDHQQLKPTPTVYQLAQKYNLEISLFERMINNKVEFRCLEYQHRMRPEISKIAQIIYPDLKNHDVVNNYDDVLGVTKNVFLVSHSEPESTDDEIHSHSNEHEAKYVAALCRYLLLQGYHREDITVLTLYSGQLYCIKQNMPKTEFAGVRVTSVDNYQGEENEIVLLSLVRSNDENKIGFVKTENRICVALSRAKKGLYVVGNFDLFQNNSDLWNKIVCLARNDGFIGDGLSLFCQNHPAEDGILAKTAKDFDDAPEGGCMKPCRYRLNCGHTCTKVCHVIDKDHESYICPKPCSKIVCDQGHLCSGVCGEKCPKCMILMPKNIPKCGHLQDVPCSIEPGEWTCTEKCTYILPCGHNCQRVCGESHTDQCKIKIRKTWKVCGHTLEIPCYKMKSKCLKPCLFTLDCGHVCNGTCGQCLNEKMHVPCKKKCNKKMVCGHACTDECSICLPCKENCQNYCSHSVCKKTCGEPCVPCMEDCTWECQHYKCTMKCFEPCNRPQCYYRCTKKLKCGHNCIGICGEKCPVICGTCHEKKLYRITKGNIVYKTLFVQLEDCKHLFDFEVIDEIMNKVNRFGNAPVSLPCCPLCKTPIRRSTRYGKAIKTSLQDIEKIKQKLWANNDSVEKLASKLKLCRFDISDQDSKTLHEILKQRKTTDKVLLAREELNTFKHQIGLLCHIKKLRGQFGEMSNTNLDAMNVIDEVRDFILKPRNCLTSQQRGDVLAELQRLSHWQLFLRLENSNSYAKLKQMDASFLATFDRAKRIFADGKRYDEKRQIFVQNFIGILVDCHVLPPEIKNAEISLNGEEIFPVDGLWLKCRHGHVFMKNKESRIQRCPDCVRTLRYRRFQDDGV